MRSRVAAERPGDRRWPGWELTTPPCAARYGPASPFYALWTVERPSDPHVHHRRGTTAGPVQHGGLLLAPHPLRPVAALGDVLIHALRCLPPHHALVMVECAVQRGDMTIGFLRERLPGRRNGRAREVLMWVDRGADSMLETLARTRFRQAGIRVTQCKVLRATRAGSEQFPRNGADTGGSSGQKLAACDARAR